MAGLILTGIWEGLFSYPRRYRAALFTATLIETESRVSGSTHEQGQIGDNIGRMLYATLLGRRQGHRVLFVKTYEEGAGMRHTVEYDGTLSEDATEIEGRWFIPLSWSGRFIMVRPGAQSIEAKREAFENV